MDDNQLQLLIKVKGDTADLSKIQDELNRLKDIVDRGGGSFDIFNKNLTKAGASTLQLQRAGSALSSVLQGNVVGALGAVRGATTAMLGPIGLAMAAVTAIVAKAQSMWQAQKAAEAARAADDYAWTLARASENAEDLAKKSTDAFAAAITNARKYYEETSKALEQQFQSIEKIGRAKLALDITKTRNDPNLTAQQKILEEQRLIAEFATADTQAKEKLLNEQQALAQKARDTAAEEKAAAQLALDAAKEKTESKDWFDNKKIAALRRGAASLDFQNQSLAQKALDIKGDGTLEGGLAAGKQRDAIEATMMANKAKIATNEKLLATELDIKTAENRRKDTLAGLEANLEKATAAATQTDAALASINNRVDQFNKTDKPVSDLKAQTEAAKASAQASAAGAKSEKEKEAAAQRAARQNQQNAIAEIENAKRLAAADPTTTRAEKQQIINTLIGQETALLNEMIAARKKAADNSNNPEEVARLEAEIIRLKQKLAQIAPGADAMLPKRRIDQQREDAYIRKETPDNNPNYMTAGEGIEAGIYTAGEQLGSVGDNLANLFGGTLLDSVNAISDGIYGWITGTESFGDVLRNLGDQIFKELLNTIVKIGAQWLINTLLVKTGIISIGATQDAQRTQQTGKTIAAQAATLPGATANAAATGISSWGVALAFGALAIAMILAAAGAFAGGGPVDGKKQLAWLNDGADGPEFVVRGAAHAKYGTAMLSSINAGTYDPSGLMNNEQWKMYNGQTPAGVAASALASHYPLSIFHSSLGEAAGNAPASSAQTAAAALAAAMPKQQQPKAPNQYFFINEDDMRQRMFAHGDFATQVTDVLKSSGYKSG